MSTRNGAQEFIRIVHRVQIHICVICEICGLFYLSVGARHAVPLPILHYKINQLVRYEYCLLWFYREIPFHNLYLTSCGDHLVFWGILGNFQLAAKLAVDLNSPHTSASQPCGDPNDSQI